MICQRCRRSVPGASYRRANGIWEEPLIQLTQTIRDLLNSALADGTFCLVATATKDGYPQVSPKGSVVVFNDDTLCYWERSNRSAAKRVHENSHVCIYYRNPAKAGKEFRGGVIRFYG